MIHLWCATCRSLSPTLLVTSHFLLSTISSHYGMLTFDFDRIASFVDPAFLVSPFVYSTFDLLLVDLASCYRGRNLPANRLILLVTKPCKVMKELKVLWVMPCIWSGLMHLCGCCLVVRDFWNFRWKKEVLACLLVVLHEMQREVSSDFDVSTCESHNGWTRGRCWCHPQNQWCHIIQEKYRVGLSMHDSLNKNLMKLWVLSVVTVLLMTVGMIMIVSAKWDSRTGCK